MDALEILNRVSVSLDVGQHQITVATPSHPGVRVSIDRLPEGSSEELQFVLSYVVSNLADLIDMTFDEGEDMLSKEFEALDNISPEDFMGGSK